MTLPIDVNLLTKIECPTLDMSDIRLDVDEDKRERAVLVYLRNTGMKAQFDFSNCSYEQKERYLNLYLTEPLDVNTDILASTWIEILSARDGGGVVLPSILSSDEIGKFLERNNEFVQEIYQFINSLPAYALYCLQNNDSEFSTNELECTSYNKLKMENFHKLADFDAFILLADGTTTPKFYEEIFGPKDYYMSLLSSKLPYAGFLTALTSTTEFQDEVVDRLEELVDDLAFSGKGE